MPAPKGNMLAVTHGARSEAQIRPVARAQKRRLLRQTGLRAADLRGIGLAYLDNWARAQAKVDLLDRHFAEHGFLNEDGEPRGAVKVYFAALNSARLALARLEEHLAHSVDVAPLAVLEGEGRRVRLEAEQRLADAS